MPRPQISKTDEQALLRKIEQWRNDPERMVREVFGVDTLDVWQKDYFAALRERSVDRFAMKAAKGVGKTAALAWTAWWALICFKNMEVYVLANTGDQLRDGLMKEIVKWAAETELSRTIIDAWFEIQTERIISREAPGAWFLSARTFPKSASEEDIRKSLQGLHKQHICALVDETGGMPTAVIEALEPILHHVKPGCRFLSITGNPTHRKGALWDVCTRFKDVWWIKTIHSIPGRADRSMLVPEKEAQRIIDLYGWDDDNVKVSIRGEFPDKDFSGLFPDEVLEASPDLWYPEDAYRHEPKILGVDVARMGDDMTVLAPRQGRICFDPVEIRRLDTVAIVDRILRACDQWMPDAINVDGTGGYGAGVVDLLKGKGVHQVNEVKFNESAYDERYLNRRAEMYGEFAEWVKNGGSLPRHKELLRQMSATTYYVKNDKMALIPKETIKRDTKCSPDHADAYALTFSVRGITARNGLGRKRTIIETYDPLTERKY